MLLLTSLRLNTAITKMKERRARRNRSGEIRFRGDLRGMKDLRGFLSRTMRQTTNYTHLCTPFIQLLKLNLKKFDLNDLKKTQHPLLSFYRNLSTIVRVTKKINLAGLSDGRDCSRLRFTTVRIVRNDRV